MPYSKSLDGLRGAAVLLVLLVHAVILTPMFRSTPETYLYAVLRYGWIGVDCFFVLSGFLITTILLADRAAPAGQFFSSFYARRALRIFPIYYLFLLALFLAKGADASGSEWLALATYTHNFYRMFEPSELHDYAGHLWSLAIEEQFYLVWPAVVYFLPAKQAAHFTVLLITAIVYFRSGLILTGNEGGLYINTFTRGDSLLVGALLAYVRSTGYPFRHEVFVKHRRALLWAGTTVLVAAQVIYDFDTDNAFNLTGGYTVLAVVFACVLSNALESGNATKTFLEQRWLCSMGKVSYGAYLYHIPVFTLLSKVVFQRLAFWREGWWIFDMAIFLICCGTMTFLLAALSYLFIERPLLARKPRRIVGMTAPTPV